MNLPSSINIITNISEYKFKVKGSLFICTAVPVFSENEAAEKLNEFRKKYYDSTHNCYAYYFTDGKMKYSDDGEPNGTAGIRILNAINRFELSDILIVITRYFGGTKLGVGPLGKAYYDCASGCIEQSVKATKYLHKRIIIGFPFELSNLVHRTISKYNAKIEETEFDKSPKIRANVLNNNVKFVIEELQSASNGKIKTEITNDIIYF